MADSSGMKRPTGGADEPAPKRQALDGAAVKVEPGTVSAGLAIQLKKRVKEALAKRKQLLEQELSVLESGGSLLDLHASWSGATLPARVEGVSGRDRGDKGPGLTDQEKLILQKAKMIEAKNRFKAKWPEPPRRKVHHDYLLEEMTWLSTDFKQERKWKMALAKKVALAVVKWHSQKQLKADKADKDKETKVRKNASKIAREVRKFWSQIETLSQHKQQVKVDMEKKKVLNKHLDFLVDQTEKYSTMIAQNLAAPAPSAAKEEESAAAAAPKAADASSGSGAAASSSKDAPASDLEVLEKGDTEFSMNVDDEEVDDEETLDEAEKDENREDTKAEVDALQAEQDMPIEELLKKLGYVHGEADDDDDEEEEDEDEDEDAEDDAEEGGDDVDMQDAADAKPEAEAPAPEAAPAAGAQASAAGGEATDAKDAAAAPAAAGEGKPGEEGTGLSAEARDVADMARTLAPTGHTLATTQVKTAVPFLLSSTLKMREYQHIALDWMVALHDKGLNGILADEMGLGKTIMTISVLAYLACERGNWGPHLIVVPTTLLLNWEIEFKRWCPSFKVLTYYGSQKERKLKRQGWSKHNSFHVCITSYKMVVQDQKMFRRKRWKYMILDEAHNIKNFQSQRWQVLLGFRTKRRILLTGTPLQNNLMELWSLLHFLMPHIFTSHSEFRDWFANPLMSMVEGTSQMNDTLVQRLHSVLRPFILRRLKKDVETQLPDKHEHVVPCRLSKRQRCLYDDFMAAGSTQTKLASGNLLEIINVLMQLRKVCNHPDLFEERPIVSPFDCLQTTMSSSGDFFDVCKHDPRSQVDLKSFNFILGELEGISRAQSDVMSKSSAASKKLIVELSSGKVPNTATAVESGRQAWSSVADFKAHLAQRRQAVKSQCLTQMMEVNTRRCDGMPVFSEDLRQLVKVSSATDSIFEMDSDSKSYFSHTSVLRDLVLSAEERVFGRGGLEGTNDERTRRPQFDAAQQPIGNLLDVLTNFVCIIPKARAQAPRVVASRCDRSSEMELAAAEIKFRSVYSAVNDVCRPAHIRQQLYFPDKRLLQYDCGKLQVLDEMLRKLKLEGRRVLLFTQMSKVLDVVETFLSFHGHTYVRLDGSTKIEQRQALVERFNQDPKIFVFISSTRAGGVGINLTGADTVIFYDSDWNPAMDRQAQDRCHRIGQTREVHIYRLVSEHTVEENILKKANQKRHLEDLALKDSATSLFNPDFFKKVDVREFFQDESKQPAAAVNPLAHLNQQSNTPSKGQEGGQSKKVYSDKEWEMATVNAEDERDVEAMKTAKQEEREEMDEFDENAAENGEGGGGSHSDDANRPDAVSLAIESELTAVQKYALKLLEREHEQAGIKLVEGVVFDREQWEKEQLQRIRDQESDRMYDEDEVLFYEVSGCSSQVYRELCTKLYPGPGGTPVDYGSCFEPPNPDDDKHMFINEPMYAGVMSQNMMKMKNQRAGAPQNKQIILSFKNPKAQQQRAGQPLAPGGNKPPFGRGGPQAQQKGRRNERQISAADVPWTKEEEMVLKEAVERFQGSQQPIRTWHLHASILNASIAARGRFRMGKHCMEYYNARLGPVLDPVQQQQQQQKQLGPPRVQTQPPTREDNMNAIVRSARSIHKPPPPPKSAREATQIQSSHNSHSSALTSAASALGVAPGAMLSPTALIQYVAKKAPAPQTQGYGQVRAGPHGSSASPGGPQGQLKQGSSGQSPGVRGMVPAGGQRPGMAPGQSVPAGMKVGQPHSMQAGRPGVQQQQQQQPGKVGMAPGGQAGSAMSGAGGQMGMAQPGVGMQRPGAGGAPGQGVQQAGGARLAPNMASPNTQQQHLHQQQMQRQQAAQQQQQQQQAARQAQMQQQQMRVQGAQPVMQPHAGVSGVVRSSHTGQAAYSQPMGAAATGHMQGSPGGHPQPGMQHAANQQQKQLQAQQMASQQQQQQQQQAAGTRNRKPKTSPTTGRR